MTQTRSTTRIAGTKREKPGEQPPVCGKCGYDALYRSRLRWYDLPFLVLFRPYRCNKCYRRFYKPRLGGRPRP